MASLPVDLPLGQPTEYPAVYNPSLLRSLPRADARRAMSIDPDALPFQGEDLWVAYEFSWLGRKGLPRMAGLRIRVPCKSPCIVESKSLKLYLNSFAQTPFNSSMEVLDTLNSDLKLAFRQPVLIDLLDMHQFDEPTAQMPGILLDELDVETRIYERDAELLKITDPQRYVKETCHTHLFRSLCPVTGQPDWASVMIQYAGPPMDRRALLEYLVSFRCHTGFHEQAIEQIFMDLKQHCRPEHLSVYGRFLRRGGIDINPYRSTDEAAAPLLRLSRQ